MSVEVGRETGRSAGGVELSRLVVPAQGEVVAGLAMVHGLGDHSGRYGEVLAEFARRGITSVAADFPGHGQSAGARGHIESRSEAHSVIAGSVARLRELVPDRPLGIGAHSMGALMVLDYFVAGGGGGLEFAWLSSALVNPAHGQPWPKRCIAGLLELFVPRLTVSSGVRPADCYGSVAGDPDIEAERAGGAHDRMSLRLGMELLRAGDRVAAGAGRLFDGVAVLMTHGTDDRVCPLGYASSLFGSIAARDKEFIEVAGALHEPWHDPAVVDSVARWIGARL